MDQTEKRERSSRPRPGRGDRPPGQVLRSTNGPLIAVPPRPEDSLQDLVSLYRPLILNADGTQAEREAELQTYTLDASLLTALQQRLGGSGDIPRTVTMWSLLLLGVKAREADGEESGRAARAVWQRITEAVGLRSETIIRLPAFSGRPELVAGKLETVLRRVLEAALGVTRPRT